MLVLCLDTATPDVAAAVVEVSSGRSWPRTVRDPRGAGEHLMPLVAAALADAGAVLADLEAVVVGLGPGPYTGLRAGVVTAAALGLALDIPAHGACSLDVWAAGDCLVATDARRREVFWATYEAGVRVDGPHVARPADVPMAVRGAGAPRAVPGAGASVAGVLVAGVLVAGVVRGPGAVLLGAGPDDRPCPVERLAALVDLGAAPRPLVPTYLRRPDAALPPGR